MRIDIQAVGPGKKFLLGMSWLDDLQTADGKWGVGCFICTEYADDDGQKSRSDARKFANFEVNSVSSMQMCNFKNHHNCPGHKRNVMKYLGLDAAAAEQGADLSPSKEDFEQVWNHVCAGGPLPLIIIIIIVIIIIIIIRWNCSGGH